MKKITEPKQPDFYYQFNDGLHKFPNKKRSRNKRAVKVPPKDLQKESIPVIKAKKKNWQKIALGKIKY